MPRFSEKLLTIEVTHSEAKHIVGSFEGRSWDFWTQSAFFSSGDDYPVRLDLRLAEGSTSVPVPYAPGQYMLGSGSLQPGRKGIVFDGLRRLVPLSEAIEEARSILEAAGAVGGSSRRPAAVG